ncbi:hypothetical protein GW17_00055663 [Ensete ventricosum]|nr:hypothetical protein GW17_00055663 [Ensete ventricosum]
MRRIVLRVLAAFSQRRKPLQGAAGRPATYKGATGCGQAPCKGRPATAKPPMQRGDRLRQGPQQWGGRLRPGPARKGAAPARGQTARAAADGRPRPTRKGWLTAGLTLAGRQPTRTGTARKGYRRQRQCLQGRRSWRCRP